MNTSNLINKIIELPKIFYEKGNVPMYSLLKETGYFEAYNKINEKDVLEYLSNNLEHSRYWLRWSENKRVSSGWYFKEEDDGKYTVGYFFDGTDNKCKTYDDINAACAAFIKQEIEEIRKS